MMNYFDLYELPMGFAPDAEAVKKKFYELSRKYHPDRYTLADDAARMEALRMAAINNDAYKVLNNADATMAYILKQHGVLEEEEKYSLPPDFLMEMMDLNEAISEYEMEQEDATIKQQAIDMLNSQLEAWELEVAPLVAQYGRGEVTDKLLADIKDYYFRKKYLLRIQQRINTFAAH